MTHGQQQQQQQQQKQQPLPPAIEYQPRVVAPNILTPSAADNQVIHGTATHTTDVYEHQQSYGERIITERQRATARATPAASSTQVSDTSSTSWLPSSGDQLQGQHKDDRLTTHALGEGDKRVASEDDGRQSKKRRAATLMSEEDKDLLNSRLPELISNIGIEDGMLLAHLRSRGALTKYNEEKVKSERDRNSQVRCLIDLLLRRDSDTVDKLIYSLLETGQSHVVDKWLRQPRLPDDRERIDHTKSVGAASILSEADTNLLERWRPRIMADLKLTDGSLLAELRAWGVLTESEEGFIKGITGSQNAVGYVVDLLLRKSPRALEGFLHSLNNSGYTFVVAYLRQPSSSDRTDYVRGGSSTTELANALRQNLRDRLNEWKTALEEGSCGQEEKLQYIDQPCSVKTKGSDSSVEESTVPRAIQVVEESVPGDRIVVYGEAGMGKTTLLKQLTRSWIESTNKELVTKFKYVFLIPCRLVGKISLLNIICDELELVHKTSMNELEKSLYSNETKLLFLIDSFEELRGDVAKAEKTDINDLISGRLFAKSTVMVTSRPGSKLRHSEEQKTTQLKDLPEDKVKEIITTQFDEDKNAANTVLRSFPAMSFLQKPINLALFLFTIKNSTHLTNMTSFTQAELFSQVLQYIMLAFTKKKKWDEFIPQPGSYIRNKDIPIETRSRFREIAKKCFEERKENNVILQIEETDDKTKYLEFGLFIAASDTKAVLLPHPLFQEYFAAAHLAEDSKAWAVLLEEIKEKSENRSYREFRHERWPDTESVSGSDKPLLVDILRSMGLNNVVRFLVALKPQVCQQIGELFVVEREQLIDSDTYQPVQLEYYTELLRDCSEENGKRALATALVNAPVRTRTRWGIMDWDSVMKSGSIVLWPYLTDDQRCNFLRNVYNFELHFFPERVELSCSGEKKRVCIADTFVVAFVCLYNGIVTTDDLIIVRLENERLDLPACMLSRNIPTVRELTLNNCTLCKGISDPIIMSDTDRSAILGQQHSSPCPTISSLERVTLNVVEGLEHCDVITSCQCQLKMDKCGDVRASALKTCFPRVSELLLGAGNTVVYETEEELTSWLSTVQTARSLELAPQHEGESLRLSHLLNILAGKELNELWLYRFTLLLNVRDTSDVVKQNNTLSGLWLEDCKGDVDMGQLFEVCGRQCPQLETVVVRGCQLLGNVRDDSATVEHNNTLSKLELENCKGVDLGQLLEICSRQCPQLETVVVSGCQLQVNVRDNSDTVEQNNTLSELKLNNCEGGVDLGQLLEICSRQCPQLKKVVVWNNKLVFDDEKVESVKQLPGLQMFALRWSFIHTPAGRRLSEEEVKQLLRRLFPSAEIDVPPRVYRSNPESWKPEHCQLMI